MNVLNSMINYYGTEWRRTCRTYITRQVLISNLFSIGNIGSNTEGSINYFQTHRTSYIVVIIILYHNILGTVINL